MTNLDIIGESRAQIKNIGGNRIHHLSQELIKSGIEINYHELPPNYKRSKIKFIKRIR